MCLPASEAYNSVMPLRSSSSPRRRSGAWDAIFSSPMLSISTVAILVLKKPGQIAFTLMPCTPHSAARARVKLMTAPLEVL
ncbi:hypothetical protein D3C81_2238810 [compost metagenome]